jgi:hypothetical protein
MRYEDWLQVVIMLAWGLIGFGTGYAYREHNLAGFWLGLAVWVIWPVGIVVQRVVSQTRWRRQWEREHGKPWAESDAAKMRYRGP